MQNYDKEENEDQRSLDIDLLEEWHLKALTQTQFYQARMAKAYNRKVRSRKFQIGDWVLKSVEVSRHVGKLDPKWEGPFKIVEEHGNNAYKLQDQNGYLLPRSWNASNLRRFYM